jgi:hypothetical protein
VCAACACASASAFSRARCGAAVHGACPSPASFSSADRGRARIANVLAKKELCFRPHTLPGTNLRIAFLPTTKDKAVREAFDADAGYGALPALSLPLAPSLSLSRALSCSLAQGARARSLHTLCLRVLSCPVSPLLLCSWCRTLALTRARTRTFVQASTSRWQATGKRPPERCVQGLGFRV